MGFNEQELLKIENATSGFLKGSTRKLISSTLRSMRDVIQQQESLDPATREAKLKEQLAFCTRQRQRAVVNGASSHGDKDWAVAAACESWLLSIFTDSPADQQRVKTIIDRLISRA